MVTNRIVPALAAICAVVGLCGPQGSAQPAAVRRAFDEKYAAWRAALGRSDVGLLSDLSSLPEYTAIEALGLSAVPLIVERIEQEPEDFHLAGAVAHITKRYFGQSEVPEGKLYDARSQAQLYVRWWRQGRKETPRAFEALYDAWRTLKRHNETGQAAAKYQSIVWLGIDGLPLIMDKVKAGDADLLPAVNQLTDNALGDQPTTASAVAWWEANKEKWTLPPIEPAPASQPSSKPAGQDFDQMLEEAKSAWSRKDYPGAEQLAQEILKHPQATEEHKRRAQLILDRVAESRSGAPASQPAAPPATRPSCAPSEQ